ncbi:hypothetical protein FHW88_000459 [Mucilaginibacter sp. SG538B]|uniref:hypothetical protein n=1 Tax=Mucilaginibacter sp. SG538B TaxID=2587021 RepID=UPI00159DC296|nr:hypothetical protein [Mucilaginibacter sp. SG538B]NVM62183.1 hypothetical protein [Mucilaginibacter sp. SG538B]
MKEKIIFTLIGLITYAFVNAQTKTLTVDGNDALNSNTKIVAQTSVGQTFFTGHQLGAGYSYPSAGIFRAWTDQPVGSANYYYDGVTNGTINFSVRADGQGYFGGKVGIGTTAPNVALDINGAICGANTNLDGMNTGFLANSSKMLIGWNRTRGAGETDFIANQGAGSVGGFAFYNHDNSNNEKQLMWLAGDGRLMIGLTTGATGNNKLAVGGGVIAEAVTVKLQANWPDYVFKKDYQLKPLQEVKNYIEQHQHLPEIPSEQEMIENGLNVGEMNKLLMKKVEELTLYLIEKDKETRELKESKENQQHQLDQLKQQLAILAKEIRKN